jgi:hypothetical protein
MLRTIFASLVSCVSQSLLKKRIRPAGLSKPRTLHLPFLRTVHIAKKLFLKMNFTWHALTNEGVGQDALLANAYEISSHSLALALFLFRFVIRYRLIYIL